MAFPTSDTPLVPYGANWVERLTEDPVPYGLTTAQATAFATAYGAYAAAVTALQAARESGTRSQALTADRNQMRRNLLVIGRELYAFVQANTSVSDSAKISLGVVVPDREPTPSEIPSEKPKLSVASVVDRTVNLLVRGTDERRGRPAGVIGALVFAHVGGETAPSGIDAWKLVSTIGRTDVSIAFPAELAPGTKVHFTAMWINNRKQSGPLADAVSAYLSGGVSKVG